MWIFTTVGFFSAVQKPGTDFLTVRARVRDDLDNLRLRYLPELSPTVGNAGTDYPWRATVTHAAFAAALGKIALDVTYPNFKDAVAARQGHARAKTYGKVWSALFGLEDLPGAPAAPSLPWGSRVPSGYKVAYGGVVFDPEGLVLLREPRDHFDGYAWTFPKGRPDPGESPVQAALRETREETGVSARILAPIPGEFAGGTTVNRYFLMAADAASGGISPDDRETWGIQWVTPEDARGLIQQTTNPKGRARDLAVLDAALAARA